MSSSNFPPGFENELKNLGIDFDGVIHNMDKGYYDGTCYGEPLPGALEALEQLSQDYNIIIYTAKALPSRPLVNGKTGTELVWEWLEKYDVAKYVDEVTAVKPRAILYIDDNGYRFDNWKATLNFVKAVCE
jgi:hypothetical protein